MKFVISCLVMIVAVNGEADSGTPSTIVTRFSIESPEFTALNRSTVLSVDVAQATAVSAHDALPYVNWCVKCQMPVASLTVMLVGIRAPKGFNTTLEYVLQHGEKQLRLRSARYLFRWSQPMKPVRSTRDFASAVINRIHVDFSDPKFIEKLEHFVRQVPLTRQPLWVDAFAQRVVIPIDWQKLEVDRNSVLRFEFVSAPADRPPIHGTTDISLLDLRTFDPHMGEIEGSFYGAFLCPPTVLSSGNVVWSPDIVTIFNSTPMKDPAVYMDKFARRMYDDTYQSLATKP